MEKVVEYSGERQVVLVCAEYSWGPFELCTILVYYVWIVCVR